MLTGPEFQPVISTSPKKCLEITHILQMWKVEDKEALEFRFIIDHARLHAALASDKFKDKGDICLDDDSTLS